MFGKIFSSMYQGTLATKGPWQALVTFQQMLVLCDKTGIVDMTPDALSRITTIPLDIINIGITALEQPDSESRSPDLDGRRIVRLSDTRSWGWIIVNYEKYRKIRSEDDRREYMANLMREKREKQKPKNGSRKHVLAMLAHADAEAEAITPFARNGKIFINENGLWKNITQEQVELWKKAYPAVNIETQLHKAAAWIVANPKNKKSNYARFITSWLSRAQDSAPKAENQEESRMGRFVI